MSVVAAEVASAALRWLTMHGVNASRVAAESFHGVGVGLAASSAIAAGEVVLRVPHAVWWPLSAEAARTRTQQDMPGVVTRVDAAVSSLGGESTLIADSTLLAAHLATMALYESEPDVYLRQLPVALDVPLLWPAPLRSILLQGSSCHAACESQAALSDMLFEAIKGRRAHDLERGFAAAQRWRPPRAASMPRGGRRAQPVF